MPGKVKVKVLAGRHLPVMDRSNDTTDAYVEVKLGGTVCKTDVCRKSLNPQWNSEWFKFEMDDLELQDEPLQIRLMDYDTYSANDAIGKVYIDLNPLLTNPSKTKEPSGRSMSGWIPVFDTMHGIRGEVNLMVKVELFSDLNKFRQSSCGVKFFFTQAIPYGHMAIQLHGFVEELVVNDDPEYQWIDKIRTPRASNEARQLLFLKLAGEVQRRVGLKALELGGNAVIGYRVCFDLEGECGIVVRGIGTAATLTKIVEPVAENAITKECHPTDHRIGPTSSLSHSHPKCLSVPYSLAKHPSLSPCLSEKLICSADSSPTLDNFTLNTTSSNSCLASTPVPIAFAQLHVNSPVDFVSSVELSVAQPTVSSHIDNLNLEKDLSPSPLIMARRTKTTSFSESCEDKTVLTNPVNISIKKPSLIYDSINPSISLDTRNSTGDVLEKSFNSQRRKRGSKKRDKYSTSSLLKRVNEVSIERKEPLTTGEKIRSEFLNFFRRRRRFLSGDTEPSQEREVTKEKTSYYRKSRVEKHLFFFKRKRTCSASRRSSSLRRSSSESFSLERISIESLPSLKSEDLGLDFDWSQIHIPRTEEIVSPDLNPFLNYEVPNPTKVFDIETIVSNRESISSASSITGNKLDGMPTSATILKAINDLGYTRGEKPLTLYISSLDALLVCAPSKGFTSSTISESRTTDDLVNANYNDISSLALTPDMACRASQPRIDSEVALSQNSSNYDLTNLTTASTNLVLSECLVRESDTNNYGRTKDAVISSGAVVPAESVPQLNSKSDAPKSFQQTSCGIGEKIAQVAEVGNLSTKSSLSSSTTTTTSDGSDKLVPIASEEFITPETTQVVKTVANLHDAKVPAAKMPTPQRKNDAAMHPATTSQNKSIPPDLKEVTTSAAPVHIRNGSTGTAVQQTKSQVNCAKAGVKVMPSISGSVGSSCRRSSESDLSTPPTGVLNSSIEQIITHNKSTSYARRLASGTDHFDLLEYPFVTISQLPPRFIQHIGGAVSARSVKLLERISNLEEPESRDSWWTEIRMEIRSHARSICCNVILGYEEQTTICDDVCILSATGTAAVVNSSTLSEMVDKVVELSTKLEKEKATIIRNDTNPSTQNGLKANPTTVPKARHVSAEENECNCQVCHIPYSESFLPFPIKMARCQICKKARVPDLLLATIGLPANVPICGKSSLIQAHVFRVKKDSKGEASAKEASDSVPFLEYELHRRLINKLKVKGMNAIFCLQVQICLGENLMIGVATGTAVCLAGLPAPQVPKITGGNLKADTQKVSQFQKVVQDTYDRNREFYQVTSGSLGQYQVANGNGHLSSDEEETKEDIPNVDLATGNKDAYVLEVDDAEDIDIISELVDPSPPSAFEMNNLDVFLGYEDHRVISQQVFAQIWRCRVPNMSLRQLAGHFDRLLRAIAFKLRAMRPCVMNKLQFRVELPEADELQISIVGTALGLADKMKISTQDNIIVPTTSSPISKGPTEESDLIFNLEDDCPTSTADHEKCTGDVQQLGSVSVPVLTGGSTNLADTANVGQTHSTPTIVTEVESDSGVLTYSQVPTVTPAIPIPTTLTESGTHSLPSLTSSRTPTFPVFITPKLSSSPNIQISPLPPIPRSVLVPNLSRTITKPSLASKGKYVIEVTTLSSIPGYRVDKYLGNLNCFFIRETTSIKEMGGPSGFVHNFIVEVLAIIRAHVAALGGNALVSYFMTELSILHTPHKNQGQCLINIGGDVVFILPMGSGTEEDKDPKITRTLHLADSSVKIITP